MFFLTLVGIQIYRSHRYDSLTTRERRFGYNLDIFGYLSSKSIHHILEGSIEISIPKYAAWISGGRLIGRVPHCTILSALCTRVITFGDMSSYFLGSIVRIMNPLSLKIRFSLGVLLSTHQSSALIPFFYISSTIFILSDCVSDFFWVSCLSNKQLGRTRFRVNLSWREGQIGEFSNDIFISDYFYVYIIIFLFFMQILDHLSRFVHFLQKRKSLRNEGTI
jgi:hypothetical protein